MLFTVFFFESDFLAGFLALVDFFSEVSFFAFFGDLVAADLDFLEAL
jgi:hypothetical protein